MAQSYAHGHYSRTQKEAQTKRGGRPPRDRARRELSQNFLVDPHAVDQVIKAARPAGLVLEPGAGKGALTVALDRAGADVVPYEIDPRLATRLKARTGLKVVEGDFTAASAPRDPFAVVGNIPYSITSKIVAWCLQAPTMTSATLVTQLEYARKRSGDFGRWSLLTVETWPWFHWELESRIGRKSFRPVPSVDSAILRINRRSQPLVAEAAAYQDLVELGFSGIGGSLYASLAPKYRRTPKAFAAAGIPRNTVVPYVHPTQWLTLANHLLP